jgi:hypothetical protein
VEEAALAAPRRKDRDAGPGAASGGPLDADGDGLSDAWESSLGTNPLHADSDRDGIGDALEAATGTDPLLPGDDPEDRPDHPEP